MRAIRYHRHPFTLEDLFEDSVSQVLQTDEELQVAMDVPGVPLSALNVEADTDGTIRVRGSRKSLSIDETPRHVDKKFLVDPETADLSKVRANLSAGVLALSIPKKPKAEPTQVLVTTGDDYETKTLLDDQWTLSMDVPGVKANDLQISVEHDGVVIVSGKRKVTSHDQKVVKQYKIHKRFWVNPKTTELSKMHAHLSDGVVTLVAPKKPKTEPRKTTVVVSSEALEEAKPTDNENDNKVAEPEEPTGSEQPTEK